MGNENYLTVLSEIRTVLAEKRTSLAELRTGVAIIIVPMSIFTALVATSEHYNVRSNLPLIIAILVSCIFLLYLGISFIVKALRKIKLCDVKLKRLAPLSSSKNANSEERDQNFTN